MPRIDVLLERNVLLEENFLPQENVLPEENFLPEGNVLPETRIDVLRYYDTFIDEAPATIPNQGWGHPHSFYPSLILACTYSCLLD